MGAVKMTTLKVILFSALFLAGTAYWRDVHAQQPPHPPQVTRALSGEAVGMVQISSVTGAALSSISVGF
jgi:hypothetical protein